MPTPVQEKSVIDVNTRFLYGVEDTHGAFEHNIAICTYTLSESPSKLDAINSLRKLV